jgi:hypothetical protein
VSKKALTYWSIDIGVLVGIYCLIAVHTPYLQKYMWIAFISLPIYFCAGASLPQFGRHAVGSIAGVLWGLLTFAALGLGIIADAGLNMLVFLSIIVTIVCLVHMVILDDKVMNGLFSGATAVFGGFAAIFSQGMGEWLGVSITLLVGVALGLLMGLSGGAIAKKFP